ncbi:adenosine 5'-monophosphoramidase HINT3-like [Hylaeus volcanicus]|uniref:adenosine 5'-monophosphoramidase HINT3-like n=1 Tax=Hylaeus volcanicus TaxID=313075 RepID=UPI0023B80D39|nr:adenosine 5'-monophosphoramidase HINT3-like [Hylaeus volcanicus]
METHLENCIFCKIIENKEPGDKIYEDDYVTCIKDINPASTHHYLILPKKHIRNAKELKIGDAELYDKIVSTVDIIIEQQGLDREATRTGFHWPPFNTVDHLHLHVISPIEDMTFVRKFMFRPNSYWFVSTDYVKSHLQSCS